jgi:hypothetical protein
MRLDQNGYLGIGTGTPSALLHVNGTALISGTSTLNKVVISESTGTTMSAIDGSLVIKHSNLGGTSSIVFPSTNNNNSDYGYIKYMDDVNNSTTGELSRLVIGVENDATNSSFKDCIILYSGGGLGCVGVNTMFPNYILDINGNANIGTSLNVGSTSTLSGPVICSNTLNIIKTTTCNQDLTIVNPYTLHTRNVYSDNDVLTLTCGGSNNTYINNNKLGGDLRINSSSISSHVYIENGNLNLSTGNLNIQGTSTFTGRGIFNGELDAKGAFLLGGVIYAWTGTKNVSPTYNLIFVNNTTLETLSLNPSGLGDGLILTIRSIGSNAGIIITPFTGYQLFNNTSATNVASITTTLRTSQFITFSTAFYQMF